jgi:hypothetical protein
MIKYPGTSSNIFREQIIAYNCFKNKLFEVKIRKNPYTVVKHGKLPFLEQKMRCSTERNRELKIQNRLIR